jgi:hypothetical protein
MAGIEFGPDRRIEKRVKKALHKHGGGNMSFAIPDLFKILFLPYVPAVPLHVTIFLGYLKMTS